MASMGTWTMALNYKCLLLMLLGSGWPGLGNPSVKETRLREHYIVAQVTNWSYSSQPEQLSSLPKSDPQFKKIIYSEYEADFKKEKPRNALSGLLGPTLRAEVGDTLIIHFKNLANKPLSIHPQGIMYNTRSEGSPYSDKSLAIKKLDGAVPSGQTYKYVWEITAGTGPREADPPCLTYAYYSHENLVQDFNSGLIGALLICKNGSLNENGTQKLFDREYVLMFAVFDESKSWQKFASLMYTINGYANGTLPDVQACAYDRISWHLIGMSSAPEIFSVHFNGQTLEQNHYKVSTVNLVAGASATANMSVSRTGKWLISSLIEKHLEAGMHGYLNIEDCGKPDTLTRKLSYKELRMVKNWDYFIAAEEVIWDYAQEIPDTVDRKYKAQYLENFSNLIGNKYKKAVFRQYKDASFSKRTETVSSKERGILGPVIRAEVRDQIKIVFKNMASQPYSIYVHGVTLSKEAEGVIYPSDSKENSTQGKAVQPGETYTYHWTVLDTDEPTTKDAQCITRLYHSAVDVTRDIASGLIGPLLVCKRKALNKKGIQNKADVEQHAVFAVFDENKSWYLEDNIKRYCSNPSTVKTDDPKFYKSNVMHTLNGYASDRTEILGFCQAEIVEWHLTSIGTQNEIVPVHLSGHTFLNREQNQDILHLFPMSGESATVTMDNIGTWLLSSWGSRERSNGMRLRFRDAKCDFDNTEDYDAEVVTFSSEKTESVKPKKEKEDRDAIEGNVMDYYDFETDYDHEEQDMYASMLGLRTRKESVVEEEALNFSALAIQEDTYSINNTSEGNVTVNSHLVIRNSNNSLDGDQVLKSQSTTSYPSATDSIHSHYTSLAREILFANITAAVSTVSSEQGKRDRKENATQISDSYSQTFETDSLEMNVGVQSKDEAELPVDRENGIKATFAVPATEKEQEENAGGNAGGKSGRVLTEAILHALKEMCALLVHVQQKRNISALGNTTSDIAFLAIPRAENASSLDNLETSSLSHDLYDYEAEEEADAESSVLSTNLTLAVAETGEDNGSEPLNVSELELLEGEQDDDMTSEGVLDSSASILISNSIENLKDSHHQRQKCPPKKTDSEWNVVSEKQSYDTEDLTKAIDNTLQNSSRNITMYPENKRKQETYKSDSQLQLGQLEMSNKQEALNEELNENCTLSTSGTFLKARRKNKKPRVLTPRTSKPLISPRGFGKPQASIKLNHTMLLNEANDTLTPKQDKPIVTIGLPSEDGDYEEYYIDKTDDEDSSSGSLEYQVVQYDDPYITDSRFDSTNARNPDAIAGVYLRTSNNANMRRYYIAAEEVLWDYAALRKSTVKSSPARAVYKKVIFRSYQDDTFRVPEAGGEYEEHLGILGPVIRAEVDDVIQVQFKNLASRPYSLHAHGLYYEKSSEGRSYDDQSPEWFKKDDAIMPNGTYTYVWYATPRSGPAQDQRTCRSWAYYSAVNPEKDIHSGLIGPILICQKGMLDKFNRPIDIREFVLLFMVFDEEKSWYFNKYDKNTHAQRTARTQRHHTFPAVNGILYHLQGLRMYKDEKVHWHLLNMGGPKDIHVINFHGQTFTEQGMEGHQLGVYPLLPGSFSTVEMKPSKAGVWLLTTEVGEYREAGMQASFTVIDAECKLPMGLATGIIKDSQIHASGHMGYWEPKLARLNNGGKYNAWSIGKKENEHPWIQVDLQSQVLITGIQTQGAKQLVNSLYTMEYVIAYSKDGRKWVAFKGNHKGPKKHFEGNSDAHTIKENHIDPPIVARYIRVYPTKFYNRPTLRMELLGCLTEDCFTPLGMESGTIKNAQITASSYKKTWWNSWEPFLARLNLKGRTNAWQAKSNNNHQWLQIDLLQTKKITGIITQGAKAMSSEMYVRTFSIHYSGDNSAWKSYRDDSTSMEKVFTGNINSGGQIKHYFNPPIFSRFLRVIPKTWNQSIALRIELFGCDTF
ncbi:coagulation factor V [Rhineura floridana]|uniref:coagulation factor V n=1 Tax=Rhineura floridana TaxID=261503 RepID=UPI002AC8246D|nr:coagulation factor V [Rhineura floridana]